MALLTSCCGTRLLETQAAHPNVLAQPQSLSDHVLKRTDKRPAPLLPSQSGRPDPDRIESPSFVTRVKWTPRTQDRAGHTREKKWTRPLCSSFSSLYCYSAAADSSTDVEFESGAPVARRLVTFKPPPCESRQMAAVGGPAAQSARRSRHSLRYWLRRHVSSAYEPASDNRTFWTRSGQSRPSHRRPLIAYHPDGR